MRPQGPVCTGAIPRLAVKEQAVWDGIDLELAAVIADVIHDMDIKRATRIRSELANNRGKR